MVLAGILPEGKSSQNGGKQAFCQKAKARKMVLAGNPHSGCSQRQEIWPFVNGWFVPIPVTQN
jgi:hypothetical protein